MYIRTIALLAIAILTPAYGANILLFTDLTQGTSVIPGAIVLTGNTATNASSSGEFITLINTESWDLVILGKHSGGVSDAAVTNLSNYIQNGGRAIAATWYDDALRPLFEASWVGENNNAIHPDAHPIFIGIDSGITFTNPGWGTYNVSWTPLGTAECAGTLGAGCAAIIGNGGRTILSGPLFDSYVNVAQGELYIANQINYLLGTSNVPEPATWMLMSGGLLLGAFRRYFKR